MRKLLALLALSVSCTAHAGIPGVTTFATLSTGAQPLSLIDSSFTAVKTYIDAQTFTSIGLSMPSNFTCTGSPAASGGTISCTYSGPLGVAYGGTGVTAARGNGTMVQLSAGATTTNDCVKFDANGNTVDAGVSCGAGNLPSGSGVPVIVSGTSWGATLPVGTTGNSTVVETNSSGLIASSIVPTLNQATTSSAGSFTGSLSGDVTGTQGATAIAASTVTGKALTGFSASAGTVSATDSVLTAFNKIVGNIGNIVSGVSSVFGRTGAVTAQTGDYTVTQVTGAAPSANPTFTGSLTATGLITPADLSSVQGNGSKIQLSTGTATSGDCVKFDANGNTIDAGAACGAGSGGITGPGSSTASYIPQWSNGLGTALGAGLSTTLIGSFYSTPAMLAAQTYNIYGGGAGTTWYNSAANTTAALSAPSTSNMVMQYDATNNKPYWGPTVPVATGVTTSGNTYTATFSPAYSAFGSAQDGIEIYVAGLSANTGSATLNVNSVGALAIVKGDNTALIAGDIISTSHKLHLVYSYALNSWVLLNPGISPLATSLNGFTSNCIPYQSSAGVTACLVQGTGVLQETAGVPSWVTAPSISAGNISGGTAAINITGTAYSSNSTTAVGVFGVNSSFINPLAQGSQSSSDIGKSLTVSSYSATCGSLSYGVTSIDCYTTGYPYSSGTNAGSGNTVTFPTVLAPGAGYIQQTASTNSEIWTSLNLSSAQCQQGAGTITALAHGTVSGNITTSTASTTVTNSTAQFNSTNTAVGTALYTSGGTYIGTVSVINSTTNITLTANAGVTESAVSGTYDASLAVTGASSPGFSSTTTPIGSTLFGGAGCVSANLIGTVGAVNSSTSITFNTVGRANSNNTAGTTYSISGGAIAGPTVSNMPGQVAIGGDSTSGFANVAGNNSARGVSIGSSYVLGSDAVAIGIGTNSSSYGAQAANCIAVGQKARCSYANSLVFSNNTGGNSDSESGDVILGSMLSLKNASAVSSIGANNINSDGSTLNSYYGTLNMGRPPGQYPVQRFVQQASNNSSATPGDSSAITTQVIVYGQTNSSTAYKATLDGSYDSSTGGNCSNCIDPITLVAGEAVQFTINGVANDTTTTANHASFSTLVPGVAYWSGSGTPTVTCPTFNSIVSTAGTWAGAAITCAGVSGGTVSVSVQGPTVGTDVINWVLKVNTIGAVN